MRLAPVAARITPQPQVLGSTSVGSKRCCLAGPACQQGAAGCQQSVLACRQLRAEAAVALKATVVAQLPEMLGGTGVGAAEVAITAVTQAEVAGQAAAVAGQGAAAAEAAASGKWPHHVRNQHLFQPGSDVPAVYGKSGHYSLMAMQDGVPQLLAAWLLQVHASGCSGGDLFGAVIV